MSKVHEPLVRIEWLDSEAGQAGWEYRDELEPLRPVRCISVAFLVDDGQQYKTLAMTVSGAQIWGRLAIPACAITDLRRLSK